MPYHARRLGDGPIIEPGMDDRMGYNVNGPSLIRVPDWLPSPLGRYYLYFAHHDGRYIRLAVADRPEGPWRIHRPGVLPLAASGFAGHIASPDVHVDHETRRIRMYFHGSDSDTGGGAPQSTRVALSADGLDFEVLPDLLGEPYFRAFTHRGQHYALAMPGIVYRSPDGLRDFERGPTLFGANMRHSAVRVEDDTLVVVYSNAGDCPEQLLITTVDLAPDWQAWRALPPRSLLAPEHAWEGVDRPLVASVRGIAHEPVRELRDPALLEDDGRLLLLYAVAGEHGIALATLHRDEA
ncbi:MAG: hypothetical protein H6982_14160 [Chromatiales bacterium]|nr:hypothetical protein [Chromatiales bacterium]